MAELAKPTIRKVSEAQRLERMKIITTQERAKATAERARKAAEAKAAIAQREFEKKVEAHREKARELDIMLGRLEPTRGPVAPPVAPSLFQIKRGQAGPAIAQATASRYQQRALSSIVQQAHQQGLTKAKDVQLSGFSTAAYEATKKFAEITRRGAPILQEKISVVSPTTGKVLRYPIESVVRGVEMAGMLPGGIEVMARRPEVIVPALVVGAREVAVGMPAAAIADPKQFISDIVTLGILFKTPAAIKAVPKIKPTVPKIKVPEFKPTALQKQYLELAELWQPPKIKVPVVKPVPKITKATFKPKIEQIKIIDTTVKATGTKIAKQTIKKQEKPLTPKQTELVNEHIIKLREDALKQIKKRWAAEDKLLKELNKEIARLEKEKTKVPEWIKDTQVELKVSIRKGGRSKARADAEIKKIVDDILFREALEIRAIIKPKVTKVERQAYIKKLKKKITKEQKRKKPSKLNIKIWERQIELIKTDRTKTITEIIEYTTKKKRVRSLKELLAEERAEARLIPQLRPPSQRSITVTFRQVHPATLTKNLKTYYRNVPAFKSIKYQRITTSQWSKTVDKWNSRFVPEIVQSKSLSEAQTQLLSKSIMTAMMQHKSTTALGIIRLLSTTALSMYQSLTQMQKQTVQAMIFEMLDTQAKIIGEITKAPPKPKEVIPIPPKKRKARIPVKIVPRPPKPKPKPMPIKPKEEMPMPLEIPIIPKLRLIKKKKVVKVTRIIRKEYTNFQIVNQIGGINQLFG